MTRTFTTLSLIAMAALGACNTAEKPPHGAKNDPVATTTTLADQRGGRMEYPQVEVEPGLRNWIAAAEPVVQNGEVMQVTVPIRLLSDSEQFARIQYQFMFFDASGAPLKVQPDWMYLRLEPRRQEFVRGVSMDRAASWRLRIQSNR